METLLVIEDGDTVMAEWTGWTTLSLPMTTPDGSEIPATGKTVNLPGVAVGKVEDGKFASMREYYDRATVMSQLGLMPFS